jgi:hypothetical protein
MKKIVFSVLSIVIFSAASNAQSAKLAAPVEQIASSEIKTEVSKEDKKAKKLKQEADTKEAYTAAGLTEEQIAKCNEITSESGKKSSEVKADGQKSDEEKKAAGKVITDEKNAKLKDVMGADKYKLYNDTRKKQREAAKEAKQ